MAPLRPRFAAPKQHPTYYEQVNALILSLRETTTLANIALALNTAAYTTPTGLPWNKDRLANYNRMQRL